MYLPASLSEIHLLTFLFQRYAFFQRGLLWVQAEATFRCGWRKKRESRILRMNTLEIWFVNGKLESSVWLRWSALQCVLFSNKLQSHSTIVQSPQLHFKVCSMLISSKAVVRLLKEIFLAISIMDFTKAKLTQWIFVSKDQYLLPYHGKKTWFVFGTTRSLIANWLKYLTVKLME